MGRVWRAVDEMLDRLVAVKEIRVDGQAAEDSRTHRERTLREARATARIDHPNVVRVYDVVDEGQRLWIVMELVTGRSLERIMTEEGPLSPRETARIGLGLVAALRQVHAGGVLHRDIKPGNVLVETGAGRVVLTDFGIAAIQDAKALTMVGMLVGSPDYMAPERISGHRQGPPSDLWSLGATLAAALAGNSPFTRDTTLATLHAVLYEEPRLPPAAGPLHPLLAALLTKDPSNRPGLSEVERALRLVVYPSPTPTVSMGEVPVPGEGPVRTGAAGTEPMGAGSAAGAEPVAPGPAETGPRGAGAAGPDSDGLHSGGSALRGARPAEADPTGRGAGAAPTGPAETGPRGGGTVGPDSGGLPSGGLAPPGARPPGDGPMGRGAGGAPTGPAETGPRGAGAVGPDSGGLPSGGSALRGARPAGDGPAGAEPMGRGAGAAQAGQGPTPSTRPSQDALGGRYGPIGVGGGLGPVGGVPVPGGRGSAGVGGGDAPGDRGPARVGDGPRLSDPGPPPVGLGPGGPGPAPVSGGRAAPDHGPAPVGSSSGPAGDRGGLLAAADEAGVPGDGPAQQSAGALARAGAATRRRVGAPFESAGAPEEQDGPHFRRTALQAVLGVVAVGVVIAVLVVTSGGGGRREGAQGGTATATSPRASDSEAAAPTNSPTVDGTSRPHSPPPGSRTEAGGFAWIPPQGWRRDVKTGAEVHYTSPDGRQELVGKSSLARGDLMDTWKRSEENAQQGRDYVKIRLAETRFQGYPAVVWEYTFTLRGTPWHARLLGFDADGKSYQINTWYQPEIEAQALKTYSTVKETFTVL
ncbi:protein kinase [Streptomyces sp. NPDC101165]|uniref:protein kinase domain-containing protein n=1 Tax=Streptomyces sp. NPDC101165 TaxID=3366119 RepID=UPI0037F60566